MFNQTVMAVMVLPMFAAMAIAIIGLLCKPVFDYIAYSISNDKKRLNIK